MADTRVFRAAAMDRLASPEQLDLLLRITNPHGWVVLAGLGLLVAVGVGWGFWGTVPVSVTGQGILLKSGGIMEVVSTVGGRVIDVGVSVGDAVTEGQIVARIAQPELAEQVQQARLTLDNVRREQEQSAAFGARQVELQLAYLKRQEEALRDAIAAGEDARTWFDEKIETQRQLVGEGRLTKQTLLNTIQQAESASAALRRDRNELARLEVGRLEIQMQRQRELERSQFKVTEGTLQLRQLERELAASTAVTSLHTGRIIEIMTEQGNIVGRGEPLLALDLTGRTVKELEAIVYVSSRDGKKIKPGMEIRISPSTVRAEEYGQMIGRVTYVSDFPTTPKGMLRVLKNRDLVTAFSAGSPPHEVHAELLLDPSTASRYRWSSSKGPALRIQSGTLCTAGIVVETQRPMAMVIPLIRKASGI